MQIQAYIHTYIHTYMGTSSSMATSRAWPVESTRTGYGKEALRFLQVDCRRFASYCKLLYQKAGMCTSSFISPHDGRPRFHLPVSTPRSPVPKQHRCRWPANKRPACRPTLLTTSTVRDQAQRACSACVFSPAPSQRLTSLTSPSISQSPAPSFSSHCTLF